MSIRFSALLWLSPQAERDDVVMAVRFQFMVSSLHDMEASQQLSVLHLAASLGDQGHCETEE